MSVATVANPPLVYDPFNYSLHDDPFPIYRRMRDEAPVYHNEKFNFYALSRFEDVAAAARDFKTFSSAYGTTLEELEIDVRLLINTDPPEHSKLRHLVARMLTPANVAPLEDAVRSMARELLAPHLPKGRIDIIGDFAAKLPPAIICRLLGFPHEDAEYVSGLTDRVVHRDEGVFGMPEEGVQATAKLYEYFHARLAERAGKPGDDDIISSLMAAEEAGQLSHEEVLGYIYILSIGGHETTTKLIGNICLQLYRHPEQAQMLREDPSLIPAMVEETMRFDPPTQMMARTTTRDVTLHGVTIPKHSKVALIFASANHDERKFDNASDYDIRRNPRDHLGFGTGLHACLGAALARLEARVATEEILSILGEFEVDESSLERMHSPQVRGLIREVLTFVPQGK